MRILGVSGSLRESSTNTRLLVAATSLLPIGAEMRVTRRVGELPLFTPDLEASSIPGVEAWAREVAGADGLVVSTPEYAHGYPGALKNAFDWLVGTDAFIAKPFFLLNASARGVVAQSTLIAVLETMSGIHIESATTTIPLLGSRLTVPEILGNHAFAEAIRGALRTFVAELQGRRSGTPG